MRNTAAVYIHVTFVGSRSQFLFKMGFRSRIRRIRVGKQVLDVKATEIVDAVCDICADSAHVIGRRIHKATIVQPHAARHFLFPKNENGMQPQAFQTAAHKQRHFQRRCCLCGKQFHPCACFHGLGQIDRFSL